MMTELGIKKGMVENQPTWIEEWGWVNAKNGKTQTYQSFCREKREEREHWFWQLSAEWGALATSGALSPYGPAFRPNWLGAALKNKSKK